MFVFIEPDPAARRRVLPAFFDAAVRYGQLFGQVYTTHPDVRGAAIWIAPEHTSMTEDKLVQAGFDRVGEALGEEAMGRFMQVIEAIDPVHEQAAPGPHWYLLGLGTDPTHQSTGVGSALIAAGFAVATAQGLPAYLETMNEKNVAYYQNRGFRLAGEGQVPSGPRVWTFVKTS
ncbi:MAG: Acetyltransferase family protein [Chloroflexi bacterium]|nr:Acetyltransferase family protein [Chloroflexota bacterium]